MSMSSPAESKGLPDWAFRLYMGVFYVIAIFMVSVAFANVSALLSPFLPVYVSSCFEASGPPGKASNGPLPAEWEKAYFADQGSSTKETEAVEAAALVCTPESCSADARKRYADSAAGYAYFRATRLKFARFHGGQDGLEKGWAYFETAPHVNVINSMVDRINAGMFDVREAGDNSDILAMVIYGKAPAHPCGTN